MYPGSYGLFVAKDTGKADLCTKYYSVERGDCLTFLLKMGMILFIRI